MVENTLEKREKRLLPAYTPFPTMLFFSLPKGSQKSSLCRNWLRLEIRNDRQKKCDEMGDFFFQC